MLAVWSISWIRRLRLGWVTLNALPLFVLLGIWIIAYGPKSLEAFHHLRQLAVYAPKPSLDIGRAIASFASRDPRAVLQLAGPALIVIFAALALGAWRSLTIPVRRSGEEHRVVWRSCLLRLTAILLVQCALIQYIVPGFGSTRIVLVVPFAALCLGAGLSYLRGWKRRLAIAGVVLLCVFQVAVAAGYLAELRHNWEDRHAQRFDRLVAAIPAEARVVAVPEFWFAFQSHYRRLALIYRADDEHKYWSDAPGAFDPYDVVILDPLTPEYASLPPKRKWAGPSNIF